MPTLGTLRQRIVTEIVRQDIAPGGALYNRLNEAIEASINYYENERFTFNEQRVTGSLTASAEYVNLPSGQEIIDALYVVIGGVRFELTKRSVKWIEGMYSVPQIGQPTDWCAYGNQARLWPTPGQIYQVIWLTVSDDSPVLDYYDKVPANGAGYANASTNDWTQSAYDLITARTKMYLFRDQFRDADGYAFAEGAEKSAYIQLKGQANRQLGTGIIRANW